MALLDRIKERVQTSMSDAELQSMADAVLDELNQRYGPDGQTTVDLIGDADGGRAARFLHLPRRADTGQTITVVETEAEQDTTLDSADFRTVYDGRMLERLLGGPNGAQGWAPRVRVTYTPISETERREEIVIKIVQLDLNYRGLESEAAGADGWRVQYQDVKRERARLLASLNTGLRMA